MLFKQGKTKSIHTSYKAFLSSIDLFSDQFNHCKHHKLIKNGCVIMIYLQRNKERTGYPQGITFDGFAHRDRSEEKKTGNQSTTGFWYYYTSFKQTCIRIAVFTANLFVIGNWLGRFALIFYIFFKEFSYDFITFVYELANRFRNNLIFVNQIDTCLLQISSLLYTGLESGSFKNIYIFKN